MFDKVWESHMQFLEVIISVVSDYEEFGSLSPETYVMAKKCLKSDSPLPDNVRDILEKYDADFGTDLYNEVVSG
jgi:hypothetical protein